MLARLRQSQGDAHNVNRGRNTGQGRVVLDTKSDSSTNECTHCPSALSRSNVANDSLWNKTQKREKDLPLSFSRGYDIMIAP
jgi:hypothetical protein